jgi:hypothetical protein
MAETTRRKKISDNSIDSYHRGNSVTDAHRRLDVLLFNFQSGFVQFFTKLLYKRVLKQVSCTRTHGVSNQQSLRAHFDSIYRLDF